MADPAPLTFPSTLTVDPIDPRLLDQVRRLGDLYGSRNLARAVNATQDETRLGGADGIITAGHTPVSSVQTDDSVFDYWEPGQDLQGRPQVHLIAAVIAATSTFADQLHLHVDACEMRGAIRELLDACRLCLDLDGVL
jgi:hypothetical protein